MVCILLPYIVGQTLTGSLQLATPPSLGASLLPFVSSLHLITISLEPPQKKGGSRICLSGRKPVLRQRMSVINHWIIITYEWRSYLTIHPPPPLVGPPVSLTWAQLLESTPPPQSFACLFSQHGTDQ